MLRQNPSGRSRRPHLGSRPHHALVCGALAALTSVGALACTKTNGGREEARSRKPDAPQVRPTPGDADGDGVEDALEDALAERFAPIVFHGDRETTFPTNVDHWLALTDLLFASGDEAPQLVAAGPLVQAQLLGHSAMVQGMTVVADGSRSLGKRVSFFLGDVGAKRHDSGLQPDEWITYVHSYPNTLGGVTLQYWRAYMMNDASVLGVDLSHGGDWEAIGVHLDKSEQTVRLTYLNHSGIVDVTGQAKWENSHPLVWSEEGSHSSYTDSSHSRSTRWFRQETWTGGSVTRWDSTRVGVSGGLRNVGERGHPRNTQLFVRTPGYGAPAIVCSLHPDTGDQPSTKPVRPVRAVLSPTAHPCGVRSTADSADESV